MMRKLLIVDDEAIIRKGIRHYIDWSAHDIEVVGEAANGADGLKAAISQQPDIIVSDIRMPIMDGLEMAHKIKELMPQIKLIMLSGHSDKEYLLSAIKLSAVDFVLKSASPSSIVDSVLKAKAELEAESSRQQNTLEQEELLEKNFRVLRQAFMRSLLSGNILAEELEHRAKLLHIRLQGPYYALLYFQTEKPLDEQIFLPLGYLLESYTPFFSIQPESDIWCLLNLPQNQLCKTMFDPLMAQLARLQSSGAKLVVSGAVGALTELPAASQTVRAISQRLCWQEEGCIQLCSEQRLPQNLPLDILLRLESEILEAFSDHAAEDYREKTLQFYYVAKAHQLPFGDLKKSARRMIATMYRLMNRYEQMDGPLQRIDLAERIQPVFDELNAVVKNAQDYRAKNPVVLQATRYIEAHYQHALSLGDIAGVCYVSSAYLSKLFKEDMGIGVVEYIRKCRMKKAKELLLDGKQRISDISALVGYNDYKRFSACFLQETGISPRDYRRQDHKSSAKG